MSQLFIQHYLNELQTLRRVGGTSRESVVREAFKTLLKDWGRSRDLIFIPEYEFQTTQKTRVYPDGALLHALRVPLGYWEAKDEEDDLDKEIAKKFRKGYPQDNIIFDDSHNAILIQNKQEVMRCGVEDSSRLQQLLELFFSYEREEISDFRKAVEQFKSDLPDVLKALREMTELADVENQKFRTASAKFLKQAQDTINPSITAADVREMLIQHILTEEIFSQVFDNADFHRQNNVAKELYFLENTFFTGRIKHDLLSKLRSYYAAIKSAAALVTGHQEKQKFLKTVYENFYRVYDKKKADRLGVVYTPNEIVRFMVDSTDWLCQKHFGKSLIDKGVEILDPAAGTGTFITELIEHFRGQPTKLRYKYLEELHANEVAILPYYVANLNIEATYAAINGFEEYPNLCFVDTLDNTAALDTQKGQHVGDLFGGVSDENVARIERQNKRKISIVIGNPPYNANQLNENENNKNREYPEIDRRIKATYIAASTAQKTKLYDMYARFFRWASNRVDENGIVAFVTNRSFIESRTFDGFRKTVSEEFNDIYVVDLGGDVRADPRLSGTKHNVFGIQTGVAISFMVKRAKAKGCRIHYASRPSLETAEEKLAFLGATKLEAIELDEIRPSPTGEWLNQNVSDFESFIPIADKATKSVKVAGQERAIFKTFSLGVVTARDEWVYGEDVKGLEQRVRHLIEIYSSDLKRLGPAGLAGRKIEESIDGSIKWTRLAKNLLNKGVKIKYDQSRIISCVYRPFSKRYLYFSDQLNEMQYRLDEFYGVDGKGAAPTIVWSDPTSQKPFMCMAVRGVFDLHLVGAASGSVGAGISSVSPDGERFDNITDWAVEQFRLNYSKNEHLSGHMTKENIFHYVYAVLHNPIYREKYSLNLKREFPRVPYYSDFLRWCEWGRKLFAIHADYEVIEPWPLERVQASDEKSRRAGLNPKPMLKADRDAGVLYLDGETQLRGVPAEAWEYKLGNRSALEWVLDQYKEKTLKDPTVREKLNTYSFADHKEDAIDCLGRVTRVSVQSVEIIEAMRLAKQ